MPKGVKILFLIIIISIIVMAVVLSRSRINNISDDITVNDSDNITKDIVDTTKQAQEYEDSMKEIMPRYQELLQTMDIKKITSLRNDLLSLKMPQEYRDGHVQFVLLLDSLEAGSSPEEIQEKLNALITEYTWLQ